MYVSLMEKPLTFFHTFKQDVSMLAKPERFTFPFCYEPHSLSVIAAEELQHYLLEQTDFEHPFGLTDNPDTTPIGKMFGVLVVENQHGQLGYLAACSGKLAGRNRHRYFVPPIFDMLEENSFFLREEREINQLNREIEHLEQDIQLDVLQAQLEQTKSACEARLSATRALHKANKAQRKAIRTEQRNQLSEASYTILEQDLIKQS